jgi:hypothetical protein
MKFEKALKKLGADAGAAPLAVPVPEALSAELQAVHFCRPFVLFARTFYVAICVLTLPFFVSFSPRTTS